MKRQIKFRAWHKAEEKMCEVNLLRPGVGAFLVGLIEEAEQIINIDDKRYLVTPRDWEAGRFCDIAEFELMQFTGLYDKEGRPIYEGDIIPAYNGKFNAAVEYENGSFMWAGLHLGYDEEEPFEAANTDRWAVVIGDIYSTPELLSNNK